MEFLALAAVTLAGTWLAVPAGRGAGLARIGRLGQGYLVGALATGFVASWFERSGVTAYAWPLLALVALAAVAALVREARQLRAPSPARTPWLAFGLLAVLALAHAALAWLELRDRAPFPWDAWTNWLFRARAWFLEPGAPFAPAPGDGATPVALQVPGAHYPAAIPGLLAWLARCAGEWSPGRLLVAWPLAYLAAIAAFAAFADDALRSRRVAALAACALAATPLVVTHAMLAGYADLWVMGTVVLALGAVHRWRRRRRFDVPIAVALALPLLAKVEGLVWVALLLLAVATAWRPRVVGVVVAVAAAVGVALVFAWPGGIHLFDERLVLSPGLLRIPYLGETPLMLNPILPPLLNATLLGDTFGWTLWAALAAVLAALPLRRERIARHGAEREAWRAVSTFALYAAAFLVGLFGFTLAGRWALDQTSLSRVLMQLLPLAVLLAARVFEPLDPAADTRR